MSDMQPYDPVPELVRMYLSRFTMLFLGYSFSDYNLRLLFKTLRWRVDLVSSYSVDLRPDPLVKEILEHRTGQVNYIVQNVWDFVPALPATLGLAKAA